MQNKSLGNDKPQICPTQVDKKQLRVSAGWLGLPSASQRGSRQILAARREVSSSPRCLSAPYRQAQTSCFGCEGCRDANPGSPGMVGAEAMAQRVHPDFFPLLSPRRLPSQASPLCHPCAVGFRGTPAPSV